MVWMAFAKLNPLFNWGYDQPGRVAQGAVLEARILSAQAPRSPPRSSYQQRAAPTSSRNTAEKKPGPSIRSAPTLAIALFKALAPGTPIRRGWQGGRSSMTSRLSGSGSRLRRNPAPSARSVALGGLPLPAANGRWRAAEQFPQPSFAWKAPERTRPPLRYVPFLTEVSDNSLRARRLHGRMLA
jgi:hypothetical protein